MRLFLSGKTFPNCSLHYYRIVLTRSVGGVMEPRHLRYFVAVTEALGFTKAAENLHLAQPSLTRQIKALETDIVVRRIDRSGKLISLTCEVEPLLLHARRLLAETARHVCG